jgi:hypothetical protein
VNTDLRFEVWSLEFLWSLELGIWSFGLCAAGTWNLELGTFSHIFPIAIKI